MNHPTVSDIEKFVIGADEEIAFPEIEAHFDTCEHCAGELQRQAKLEVALSETAREAQFCPGCSKVVAEERCEHCGAAIAPGGYKAEQVLVSSAHGRVYLARDERNQPIALKELLFTSIPDTKTLMAFEKEAKLLKQLSHPAIPRFIASFQEGEGVNTRLYVAQEYIAGESLGSLLEHRRFTELEVIDIAHRVLQILCYLHNLTPPIYHRDIKPANLIQRPNGSVALVDFGSARDLEVTGGASLVGTFGYIPPEQLVGMVDETSDLYALGATMLHLLTRRPPWQVLGQPRSFSRLNISLPLRKVIEKLTAERGQRYASASEALRALDAVRHPTEPSRWWRPLAVLATTLAVASFGTTWYVLSQRQPGKTAVAPPPVPKPPPAPASIVRMEPPKNLMRSGSTATTLEDGRVFVAGGTAKDEDTSYCLLHLGTQMVLGQETGPWTIAGKLSHERRAHASALLSDDRVLVTGGRETAEQRSVKTVDLCSVVAEHCRPAASMNEARRGHTATTLLDGRVLVVGGLGSQARSAEIYDPERDQWTRVEAPHAPRYFHTATLTSRGVLVVGGPERGAELYDLASNKWQRIANGPISFGFFHSATLLANGDLFVSGGCSGRIASTWCRPQQIVAILDIDRLFWTPVGMLRHARAFHSTVLDQDGSVVIVGGIDGQRGINVLERFVPRAGLGIWEEEQRIADTERQGHVLIRVRDDKVIMAGGRRYRYEGERVWAPPYDLTLWFERPPSRGTLIVTSSPIGADVFIDGKKMGRAPVTAKLSPGQHRVKLRLAGYGVKTRNIAIRPDRKMKLNFRFEPVPPAPEPVAPEPVAPEPVSGPCVTDATKPSGYLTISTHPYSTVYWGKNKIGETPISNYPLPAGCVGLRLVTAEGKEKKIRVMIEPSKNSTFRMMVP